VGKLEDNIMKSLKKGIVGKKIEMPSASGQAKLNRKLESGIKKIMSDFMSTEKKQTGGKVMAGMKSKYGAKMGGTPMKSKYMSKGGVIKKKNGGRLAGMTANRNAMRKK